MSRFYAAPPKVLPGDEVYALNTRYKRTQWEHGTVRRIEAHVVPGTREDTYTLDEAIAEGAYEVRKVGDDIAHATWTMDGLDWRYDTPREAFVATWDTLYAARGFGWDVNPWVWVVTFKRAEDQKCPKN